MAINLSSQAAAERAQRLKDEQMLRNEQFTMAQFAFTVSVHPNTSEKSKEASDQFLLAFFNAINETTS
jgi:hypothetical protein